MKLRSRIRHEWMLGDCHKIKYINNCRFSVLSLGSYPRQFEKLLKSSRPTIDRKKPFQQILLRPLTSCRKCSNKENEWKYGYYLGVRIKLVHLAKFLVLFGRAVSGMLIDVTCIQQRDGTRCERYCIQVVMNLKTFQTYQR